MREIKFREWDPVREEMYADSDNSVHFGMSYSTRIEYDNSTGFVFRHEEDIDHEFRDKKIVDVHGEPTRKLMQYTDLHDKNGREIYESDILRVTTGEDGESYIATVKWFGDEDYPAFDLEGVPAAWNYDANALATIFQSGVETCEGIGNVHTNPELLEVDE